MSNVATLIADMVRAGVDPDLIGRTAAALADRAAPHIDEQAERRREKDRERKRLRNSAENAEFRNLSSPSGSSPIPPSPNPHHSIPPSPPKGGSSPTAKPTPRAELAGFLDAIHVDAVIEHRQRIGKPLTAHAAKLLAGKFARCLDPNAAADAMIANGWQGFEPEWLDKRQLPRGQPQQQDRPPDLADLFNERARQLQENDHDGCTIEGSYDSRDFGGARQALQGLAATQGQPGRTGRVLPHRLPQGDETRDRHGCGEADPGRAGKALEVIRAVAGGIIVRDP